MDVQWYIYKDLQVDGPFTWDELNELVDSAKLDAEDLVWNNTGLEWKEAANVPGLDYPDRSKINAYSTPIQKNKSLFSNLSFKRIALIMAAVFLLSLSTTSLYLCFSGENKGGINEPEGAFSYDTIFEDDEEEEEYYKQDKAQKELESASDYPEEAPGIIEGNGSGGEEPDESQAGSDHQTTTETAAENGSTTAVEDSEYSQVEESTISWQGGQYTGPLLNDEPHGQGLWKHPDGRNYVGDFEYGEITGYGTMTFLRGERYVGSFLKGKAHGYGTLVHPRGKKYAGEFIHGDIEGFGTMTFIGGEQYTGYFKNGVGHGQGTMTHPDGRSVSGTWINGKLTEKD